MQLTIETIKMTDHIEYRVTTTKEVQWFRWPSDLIEFLADKYNVDIKCPENYE